MSPVAPTLPADPDALLHSGSDLVDDLLALAVPHVDVDEILGARREVVAGDRGERLSRLVIALREGIGSRRRVELPASPIDAAAPASERYLPLFAALAVVPETRAHHARLGVPEAISRATLADIGRNVAVHRLTYGHAGFADIAWCRLHLTGNLYQLGRLQFERTELDAALARAVAGAPGSPAPDARPGDAALSVHIPRYRGPMDPASCDASIAAAHGFFARHYPRDRPAVALCRSWLLDRQLAEYLPVDSNIVRFARRFAQADDPPDNDRSTLRFVFGNPSVPLSEQPRRTRLERAVLDHLAGGRHWHGGIGWFAW